MLLPATVQKRYCQSKFVKGNNTMDIKREMISEEEIKNKVNEMGKLITQDYNGKNLVVIGVLKGAFVFMADLVRAIDMDVTLDFMQATSYSGTESTGIVNITREIDADVEGKDVIVVEDILDTGRTLFAICQTLKAKKANSVKVCVFLDKPSRRVVDLKADYACFTIPDKFVIGYGLDYDEKYRNLPYVGELIQHD